MISPDRDRSPAQRPCEAPGCACAGDYRAPHSPSRLSEYRWFCLEHVRAYNSAWNYDQGRSPAEIEAQIRADAVWQRPTWPLGSGPRKIDLEMAADPFEVLPRRRRPQARNGTGGGTDRRGHAFSPGTPEARAADLFELHGPLTLDALKSRYKQLVKRHHPDANGGSRQAEERLKTINLAYATLRRALDPDYRSAGIRV